MTRLALIAGLSVAWVVVLGCGPASGTDSGTAPGTDASAPVKTTSFGLAGPAGLLHVRVTGSVNATETLMLLHGGPGMSRHYLEPLEALATSTLQVVTYDQRGSGDSAAPMPTSYTLAEHVADLEAVRSAVLADTLHLLGHSWGGLVAWAYLDAHPTRVGSLIIADGLGPDTASLNEAGALLNARIAALQMMGLIPDPIPPNVADDCSPGFIAALPAYFDDPLFPVPAEILATDCNATASNLSFIAVGSGFDFTPAAASFTGPALVINGESDFFDAAYAQGSADALTGGPTDLVLIPNAGHFPWFEGVLFEAELRTFLGIP